LFPECELEEAGITCFLHWGGEIFEVTLQRLVVKMEEDMKCERVGRGDGLVHEGEEVEPNERGGYIGVLFDGLIVVE
jgi:hypothetical protein